jgi:hypothetical protein
VPSGDGQPDRSARASLSRSTHRPRLGP